MEFKHQSVLLEETVGNLRVKPDGIYVDGTLGGGGHSYIYATEALLGLDDYCMEYIGAYREGLLGPVK